MGYKYDIGKACTIDSVCQFFGISESDVLSRSKHLGFDFRGSRIYSDADYTSLRSSLFSLVPDLVRFNDYRVRVFLRSLCNNEGIVNDFCESSKSFRREPITGYIYYSESSLREEFLEWYKEYQHLKSIDFPSISEKFGLTVSEVYTLASNLGLLRYKDNVSFTQNTDDEVYATLVLLLTKFKLVKDYALKRTALRLCPDSVMSFSFIKGCFIERSMLSYLRNAVSGSKDISEDGTVGLDSVVDYLVSIGIPVNVMGSSLEHSLEIWSSMSGSDRVECSVLDRVKDYYPRYPLGLSVALALGVVSETELDGRIDSDSLWDRLSKLVRSGIIKRGVLRHLNLVSIVYTNDNGYSLYDKSGLVSLVMQSLYGLPVDIYEPPYVSTRYLLDFLNSGTFSVGTYKLPEYLTCTFGTYSYLHSLSKYSMSFSERVKCVDRSSLDEGLLQAYDAWLVELFGDSERKVRDMIDG